MRKILLSFLFAISFALKENPGEGDLQDFTQIFSLRSLENGIVLSVFRDSTELLHQNWRLRELVLTAQLRAKDKMDRKHPLVMCSL